MELFTDILKSDEMSSRLELIDDDGDDDDDDDDCYILLVPYWSPTVPRSLTESRGTYGLHQTKTKCTYWE